MVTCDRREDGSFFRGYDAKDLRGSTCQIECGIGAMPYRGFKLFDFYQLAIYGDFLTSRTRPLLALFSFDIEPDEYT